MPRIDRDYDGKGLYTFVPVQEYFGWMDEGAPQACFVRHFLWRHYIRGDATRAAPSRPSRPCSIMMFSRSPHHTGSSSASSNISNA